MTADPTRCPRFESCSAPLCPLDPNWRLRSYLRGEPVCAYLREFVKAGGEALVKAAVPHLFELIAAAAAELNIPSGPIYWPLQAAARKNSQLTSGRRLRTKREQAGVSRELAVIDSQSDIVATERGSQGT